MATPALQPNADSASFAPGFFDELHARAASTPDSAALIEPGGAVHTFSHLVNRMAAVASATTRAGITSDDIVALVLPDGVDLISTFLGVASVAGCAVLNPALRSAEIGAVLDDLPARALVIDPVLASDTADAANARKILVLNVAGTPHAEPVQPIAPLPESHRIALLLHTSATTAKARIVPLTHSNVRAMANNTRGTLKLTSADRFLSMMPLFHLQGLLSVIAQLLAGGSVVCTAGFDAGSFLPWVENYRPTWYTAGPTLHHAILPLIESNTEILEHWPLRFVRSIGAPLAQPLMEHLERTLQAPVLEGYGTTEAGAISSNTPGRRKAGSAGRTTGSEIGILGEDGQLLPANCEGEIVVRGSAVMHSYLNDPDANRTAFHDGWFRTGDLGRLDAEGFLFVTGRIKEIINRGGEKILPGEIEACLMGHPAVTEALAFGVPHPTLGEDVMAAVILRPGASISEPALRRFARERIADFKIPRRIFFASAIPKGATGKPSRAVLALELEPEIKANFEAASAGTEHQKRLAAIWQRILKIDQVDLQDDFFQLGGNSLALSLMLAEAELKLDPEDLAELLATPTVETLARIASRPSQQPSENSWVVTLQPNGSRIPFFCIPGTTENPYYFLDLARSLGQDQPYFVVRDPRPLQDRGVYTLEEHAARICAAIQSVQCEGPYLVGGHCYGGILAFEAARQLLTRGEEVSLVALFEVPTPGYPKVARHWKKYLRHSAALFSSSLRGQLPEVWSQARSHLATLKQLFRRRRQAFTRRVLVSAGMQKVIEPVERMDCRNERTGRAYVPRRLDCNVVHFIAADERHSTLILDDPRLGWHEMAGRRFSVCQVPGIADAIFRPPNVSELASQLRAHLDQADAHS